MVVGIIKSIGVLLFLYLTWRNLSDSYKDDQLVSYTWLALLSMLIGGRLAFGLVNWGIWNESWVDWFLIWQKPGFNYTGMVIGFAGLTVWFCRSNGWKLWSFLEDIAPIFLVMMTFFMMEELFKSGFNWRWLAELIILPIGAALSYFLKGKYRSWGWYRSGKKGFGFFLTAAVYCWLMSGISLIFKDDLITVFTYLILGLISVGGLFILGEVLLIKGGKKNG